MLPLSSSSSDHRTEGAPVQLIVPTAGCKHNNMTFLRHTPNNQKVPIYRILLHTHSTGWQRERYAREHLLMLRTDSHARINVIHVSLDVHSLNKCRARCWLQESYHLQTLSANLLVWSHIRDIHRIPQRGFKLGVLVPLLRDFSIKNSSFVGAWF